MTPSDTIIRFDRRTLGRFWRVARLMFVSEARGKALALLALILSLSLALTGLNVVRSFVDRDFMNALTQRESGLFSSGLLKYALVFSVMVPVAVFYRYAEERFGLFWRNWLSRHMIAAYFEHHAFYRIGLEREIDNPDQRIEEDIRSFAINSLSFALILLNSFIALVAFVSLLWSISGTLMAGALAYAAVGSAATYALGRPLIGLTFTQLRKEADYRYKLINVRDFSESIAFYGGQEREREGVIERLVDALRTFRSLVDWSRNLSLLTTSYTYVLAILPTILVAPAYFRGEMEFGTVIQAGVAFGQVLGALSVVVVHFGTLSNLAAVTTRVGTFWESLERARAAPRGQGPLVELREGPDLSFLGVSLTLPNHPGPVIRDLTLALGPEDRLLVTGPSGSGKTSLLRLLGGLCSQGSGVLVHPPREQCMFIPQRPYMPLGSFRNQLLYGTGLDDVAEPELQRVIAVTGLEATVARVGRQAHDGDWKNLLSEGEQELFAFARVLLVRPRFLFLDEASNALGDVRRAILYAELQRLGIRYLTTGSRSQLDRFHNRVLTLETGGGWSVQDLPRLARSA